MSQYKVIQDIEAEDKLLGPLSLRQFIYAGGAALMCYLGFISATKGAAFLLVIFVPPALFCMFFAWPWSPEQPTEVWALARIRFFFKPRRRIWDQAGVRDLVTITVPKKIEKIYTNGLSELEVRSRLTALADTIDSRGWAIKNVNVNISSPQSASYSLPASDRLVAASMMPQTVSDIDVQAGDDMLDEHNNPLAEQFDHMMQTASKTHRQQIVDRLRGGQPASAPLQPAIPTPAGQPPTPDFWFLHQQNGPDSGRVDPGSVVFANPQVVQPGMQQPVGPVAAVPTPSEEAFAQQLLQHQVVDQHPQNMHLRTINPLDDTVQAAATPPPDYQQPQVAVAPVPVAAPVQQSPVMTPQSDTAILDLANNNDLNVATIARQANKARNPEPPEDEVVISLH